LAVVVLVGACSNLIPPVEVDNLFGIDGVAVELEAPGAALGALALGPGTSFEGTISGSVTSQGFDLPTFINASLMEESVVIGADVQVTVPDEDVTAELGDFSVVSGALSLEVRVDGIRIGTASGAAVFNPPLEVSLVSCDVVLGDTVCSYSADVSAEDHAIVVSASATSANAVFEAMQDGETLSITGTYGVTLEQPGLTQSAVVRVILKTSGGSISF
jgi:hypothetical protein